MKRHFIATSEFHYFFTSLSMSRADRGWLAINCATSHNPSGQGGKALWEGAGRVPVQMGQAREQEDTARERVYVRNKDPTVTTTQRSRSSDPGGHWKNPNSSR